MNFSRISPRWTPQPHPETAQPLTMAQVLAVTAALSRARTLPASHVDSTVPGSSAALATGTPLRTTDVSSMAIAPANRGHVPRPGDSCDYGGLQFLPLPASDPPATAAASVLPAGDHLANPVTNGSHDELPLDALVRALRCSRRLARSQEAPADEK